MEEDSNSVKVDKWDGTAVKNALDDAVKEVFMKKLNYCENFNMIDGRLAISILAVAMAGFALLWDYLYPFPLSRPVLIMCVGSYFVMMGILTLYTTFKEKNIFMVAMQKDPAGLDPDSRWEAISKMKRFDDIYTLILFFQEGKSGVCREATLNKSVASFFDENGVLVSDQFEPVVKQLHNKLVTEKKDK